MLTMAPMIMNLGQQGIPLPLRREASDRKDGRR
jgi:hypothetical protein